MRFPLFACLCLVFHQGLFAQFSFNDATNALTVPNVTSGAPMGISDMNGDGLDDLIRLDDNFRLYIEYQGSNGLFTSLDWGNLFGTQWSLCIADTDGNGYNDLMTGGAYNNLKHLRANSDGSNYNQTLIASPSIFLQGSNFADIDNDGDSDYFACHDDGLSVPFNNNGAGAFTADYDLINTASTVPSDNSGNYGSVWTDYDNDGDTDLYISKCRLGVTNPNDGRRRNLLFRNNGDGTFTDVAEAAGLLPLGQSWATEFGDLDNDGDLDAFIINHDIPSKLYLNNSFGQFTDVTASANIATALAAAGPGIQVLFEDFDNDGWLDILYTSTGNNHCLFRNNGDGTFTNLAAALPTQGVRVHSATTGDLDDDGFVDIYAGFGNSYNTPSNTPDKLFLNNGNDNSYLKVRLNGNLSNPNGIGARLELYGDWGIQVREVRSGESYGIMRSMTRHFGIGQSTTIDSLLVRWPSGVLDKITDPAVNQTLVLTEGVNCAGGSAFSAQVSGLTVSFTDQSSIGPDSWLWDFGDGNVSTQQNPQHDYAQPGIYTVCLQTTGLCPAGQVCTDVNVSCTAPAPGFSYQGSGLSANFTDNSTNFADSWLWDFGDGTTSTEQNPEHGYAAPGDYQVCLTAANACGSTQLCQTITVLCAPPGVGYTANVSQLTVSLTDNSAPSVTEWLWTFGDGASSTAQNPQHTYGAPGPYEICLQVTDVCGSSQVCQTVNLTCTPPGAGFALQAVNLDVDFTDISQGNPTQWTWDFGDGATSTEQNPSHTYAAPGEYTICLTTANVCGSTQVCETVNLSCAPPAAGFGYQTNALNVSFIDGSANNPTEWLWDFGDGATSTEQDPQHTYDTPGTYQVCLTVSSVCGSTQVCADVTVACAPPLVGFSAQSQGLNVNFMDASGASVTDWLWDFGDGSGSSQENPSHTYAAPGTYQVCLQVSNGCGSNQVCLNITVNCAPPAAGFAAQSTGLSVNFTDQSSGNPTSWSWDFGDGTTSTLENPQHAYDNPGTYEVCLTVASPCGSTQTCVDINVTCAPPSPGFSVQADELTLTFSDQSSGGAEEWLWDFGDGTTDNVPDPQHTYNQPGTYTVCLEVSNGCGSQEVCQPITVNCSPPQAGFGFQADQLLVNFTDASTNGAVNWLWTFGDGVSSDEQNPDHTYAEPGSYQVCLTATSVCGSTQVCDNVTVSCAPPQPGFSVQANELSVSFTDQSSGGATEWLWDFGDGETAGVQNPQHTYVEPGTYEVCLTAVSICGSAQVCESVTVNCAAPQAGYTFQTNGLAVTFNDNSSGDLAQWTWSFGDGGSGSGPTPQHTYDSPGTYTVCLEVTSVCGTDQSCQEITVSCAPPQAAFGSQADELTVSFTDQSTLQPTEWLWTFGDGNSSTQQDPQHTYASPGTYQVCLTAASECGSTQACQPVTVGCAPPQAGYSFAADELALTFTDQSTNGPVQWFWDFGDGGSSNQVNPTHTYDAPGIYTICLVVSSVCGTTQSCQTVNVTCSAPQANFDFATDELTVAFEDLSTNDPTGWSWDFGDGTTSTEADPVHTYAAPGAYTVCLVAESVCGATERCETFAVSCPAPSAGFIASGGDLTIAFLDASAGEPTEWLWDFGDGNTGAGPNPEHTYELPGAYQVCLQVSSLCGADEFCQTVSVTCAPPEASFSISVNGFTQIFIDASSGAPTAWQWTFGDGGSSTQQNPQHDYAAPGVYEVCLIVENGCGADTLCQTIMVDVVSTGSAAGPPVLFEVFPNPVKDQLRVRTGGVSDDDARLRLSTVRGEALAEYAWPVTMPEQMRMLNLGPYPAGVYLLELWVEGKRKVRRVVKQ